MRANASPTSRRPATAGRRLDRLGPDLGLLPDRAQLGQLLARGAAPAGLVDPERLVVVGPGPDGQAQGEPAAGQQVEEAACLARSTVLRRGPITTMVTSRTRVVTAAAAAQGRERLDAAIHHPVQHPQAGERPVLGPPGPLEQAAAVGTRRGGWQPDPDLHARSSPGSGSALVRPSRIMVRVRDASRDHPAGRGGRAGGAGPALAVPAPPALLPDPEARSPRPPRSSPGPRTSPSRPPTASAWPDGSFPPAGDPPAE